MYEIYCKIRDEKGLKDADVARKAKIGRSTLSDWKLGRSTPKIEKLKKIAYALDVDVDYLTTGEKTRFSDENATIDAKIITNQDCRKIAIDYLSLDEEHKNLLKKYMEFLKNDMK